MDKHLQILESITELLTAASVGTPIIVAAVVGINGIISALRGDGPGTTAIADMLEAKLNANDVSIRAEIDRLRALGNG